MQARRTALLRVRLEGRQDDGVGYFSAQVVEAFLRRDVAEMEEYLPILNVAHDLPPVEALAAVQELLQSVDSEDDIALVATCALEGVVQLHWRQLRPHLEAALNADERFREAWQSVDVQMPDHIRAELDSLAGSGTGQRADG